MRYVMCVMVVQLCIGCSDAPLAPLSQPRDSDEVRPEASPVAKNASPPKREVSRFKITQRDGQSYGTMPDGYYLNARAAFDVGFSDGLRDGQIRRLHSSPPRADKVSRIAALELAAEALSTLPRSPEQYGDMPRFQSLPEQDKKELIRGYAAGLIQCGS